MRSLFRFLMALAVLAFAACGGSDGDVDATCSPWCTVADECSNSSFSQCMDDCTEELSAAQAISSQCADAVRSQNVCLAGLTCAEFDAWVNEVPPDAYPCKSADDTVISVCS
ncbi:MAG: hypothetical protein JRG70_16000 [Deltaproteobacteria bacterium]|nr:hypothetical protein [Deltaproteobacteria bacterium]